MCDNEKTCAKSACCKTSYNYVGGCSNEYMGRRKCAHGHYISLFFTRKFGRIFLQQPLPAKTWNGDQGGSVNLLNRQTVISNRVNTFALSHKVLDCVGPGDVGMLLSQEFRASLTPRRPDESARVRQCIDDFIAVSALVGFQCVGCEWDWPLSIRASSPSFPVLKYGVGNISTWWCCNRGRIGLAGPTT